MPCFCSLLPFQGVLAVTNDTPSFYRFIEDNFQSFIPWFVRDIR